MAEIELREVSLTYPVYGAGGRTVGALARPWGAGGLVQRMKGGRVEVCALNGISISAHDGDRVGIIGRNGAGKTTLLKVAAGIYRPQAGSIVRQGRTVAVINPSVGLDKVLTGYENIETIGLLSGLSRSEIRERLPDIEAFTELGDFLKLPVSTYSAGMATRLAFAVATSLHPEILIADENLGTGDAHFMEKARERMQAMMGRSSLLLLASHSLEIVRRICNRAILLDHGSIVADGQVEAVISAYQGASRQSSAA